MNRLEDIAMLGENWNGYGAGPFSKELIEKVQTILTTLNPAPEIFPTGRDTIQLEYEKPDGSYLGFEIWLNKTTCLIVPGRNYAQATEKTFIENELHSIQQEISDF